VREALEAKARAMSVTNVNFIPLLSSDAFHGLLAATDLSLITQQRSVGDIVFPSKVTTIMAAGACPIVASVNESSEIATAVRQANAGLVTEAEEGAALADAIIELKNHPECRRGMSENGRKYARKRWDGEKVLPAMERRLRGVASPRFEGVAEFAPELQTTQEEETI
jgi:colanic acid biosynthesis glycosyl transferase WcaI